MLALDSSEWNKIKASPGGTGKLTAELLEKARGGDASTYAELGEQLCHQLSVGPVAYVAVPHLAEIARQARLEERVAPLRIVGSVAAARLIQPDAPAVPAEWREEFLAACKLARALVAEALQDDKWSPSDAQDLLATLAALHGLGNLATMLFLQGGNTELSCPSCGDAISFC
jgi:hypothetical protein